VREDIDRIEYEVTPAYVIRQLLVDKGLVIHPGAREIPHELTLQCYVNEVPDEIYEMVLIKDVTASMFGHNQRSGDPFEHPGVLVNLRHTDPLLAARFAKSISKGIKAQNVTVTVGELVYTVQTVYRSSSLISLGEEVGKRRFRWAFDAKIAMGTADPIPRE
jgi:hypothetical protein